MFVKSFLLTCFIQPIKEKMVFSQHLGYYFDNPRNEYEINLIAKTIQQVQKINTTFGLDRDIFNKEFLRNYIEKWHKINSSLDSNYNVPDSLEDPFRQIARSWVIIRHEEGLPIIKEIMDAESKGDDNMLFYYLQKLSEEESKLSNYSSLIALLIQNVSPSKFYISRTENNIIIGDLLYSFAENFSSWSVERTMNGWKQFVEKPERPKGITDNFKNFLIALNSLQPSLENVLKLETKTQILDIARMINETNNMEMKMKFVYLVSIIEMLLTHNPDFKRYHVEDSISRQFKLKVAVLIYEYSKEVTSKKKNKYMNILSSIFKQDYSNNRLDCLNEELDLIYSLRSDIAHGNYDKLNAEVNRNDYKNLFKFNEIEVEDSLKINFISYFMSKLSFFTAIVVYKYITETSYVNFLKKK